MKTNPNPTNFTLPNFLSAYRLASFPWLLWLIYTENEGLFAWILCINLITDILDGWIARKFKLQTDLGARLDSLADYGTYIAAVSGIYTFKYEELGSLGWMLWVFIGLILLYNLVSFVKFQKFPSLHMYSTRIGGYIQGIFFFILFADDYYMGLYLIAMIWGFLSAIEEIIVLLVLPQLISNAKGLYWVLKNRHN
jgi:CDP-diacylglycerol--glycerol-3-phosphate 3-phosphatidyltransferase